VVEQSASPPFSQAARSFFTFMPEAYNKSRPSPMEQFTLPKDVSYLPKSAKSAGRNAVISCKIPPPFPQIMSSIWQ
jgi:hypothetical protein